MPQWGEPLAAEARAIGATCGGVRVWSLYVPNGRKLDDPHLAYKLDWLAALRETAAGWLRDDPSAQVALTGDWNIAPLDEDVFDIARFANSTHVSPAERAAFQAVVEAGYVDVAREFTPGPDVYTYWDYYRQRFERNRGLRIDFVLGSPSLASRVSGAFVDTPARTWIWLVAIAVDLTAAALSNRNAVWDLNPSHFSERHGLFQLNLLREPGMRHAIVLEGARVALAHAAREVSFNVIVVHGPASSRSRFENPRSSRICRNRLRARLSAWLKAASSKLVS